MNPDAASARGRGTKSELGHVTITTSDVPLRYTVRCTVIRYGTEIRRTAVFVRFFYRIYGKMRYGVRYGPNFESLSQKDRIELCFSSANG